MDKQIEEHGVWRARCWPDVIKERQVLLGLRRGKGPRTGALELLPLLNAAPCGGRPGGGRPSAAESAQTPLVPGDTAHLNQCFSKCVS